MKSETIKENLKLYYDEEAQFRSTSKKATWKKDIRDRFLQYAKSENKFMLLELGAGSGDDSEFFMEKGLHVMAIDLSKEMVNICIGKGIDAHQLDFFDIQRIPTKFDCIWSMNSLLHVPRSELKSLLKIIHSKLETNGLFYMGVYGGETKETTMVNDLSDVPRFYSYYSMEDLRDVLSDFFEIMEASEFHVGRGDTPFQSFFLRKKRGK